MFSSVNPATGEAFATHRPHDDPEVEGRLALAAETYRRWRTSNLDERTALLGAIADRFAADKQRLAEMAVREMGKTLTSAIAEVEKCAAAFRYYAEAGPALLADAEVTTASGRAVASWHALGPVLAIMPWNFPYWQVVRFVAPAIMAGNTGLLKHASLTQGCAALLEEVVLEAGAPRGLFQNLAIEARRVAPLLADDRIVAATLTGSEGAGAQIAEAAGRALKKVVLELGGSDPFVVMRSADIAEAAAVAVTARTQNAGQSCICAKRMIVHADVYDDFMARFSAGMRDLAIGDPMAADTAMGPLSSTAQRDEVLQQAADAVAEGATAVLAPEKIDRPGAWMTAGILTDLPPDGRFAREEIFGPVASVWKVADLDEAITRANDVPFGLGSSVWTTDPAEQASFARDLECGMVAVNAMLASTPEAPFGGVKRSGHGRELGPWGLHEFMNLKAVMLPRGEKSGQVGD
ncbi:succinate-semialdehyde dehydrogenase / glutarate-semialdehyde dehydrogenase [Sphingomonas guangdongensis]|uniref:Succinate-semialdehyde dehydrogenase / glutarate-semialdehyde dehydrogenase n=1 Tax=Sphingomonas guangdongensis TaxID=1141890 RepID=A0A285R2S2_9SPHN|nr:NAD-dependent succinate-semialdehyde dehydrogenase [Sphingomonas guangdongensis]SOB88174.1 succinate-semialdehyde dehydrogenase / glutarate-semialdehyde dehydrogenase [Sphingomonas guangdongensis]